MKTKSLKSLNVIIILVTVISIIQACKKSSDSDSFTWTWDGTNYTGNYKEAFIQSLGSGSHIIGGTGSTINSAGTGPRISVSSLNVGSYNLTSNLPNTIYFVAPNGDNLATTTGTLSITSNSNSKLTGNFSATLVNATNQNTSLSGSFTNIKINP
jgi:hypothetical protein